MSANCTSGLQLDQLDDASVGRLHARYFPSSVHPSSQPLTSALLQNCKDMLENVMLGRGLLLAAADTNTLGPSPQTLLLQTSHARTTGEADPVKPIEFKHDTNSRLIIESWEAQLAMEKWKAEIMAADLQPRCVVMSRPTGGIDLQHRRAFAEHNEYRSPDQDSSAGLFDGSCRHRGGASGAYRAAFALSSISTADAHAQQSGQYGGERAKAVMDFLRGPLLQLGLANYRIVQLIFETKTASLCQLVRDVAHLEDDKYLAAVWKNVGVGNELEAYRRCARARVPNVARLIAGAPLGDRILLVLPFFWRNKFPQTQQAFRQLAVGLLRALAGMHAAGIIHGDLKTENLAFDGDQVNVYDFGSSLFFTPGRRLLGLPHMQRCTERYCAPEFRDGCYFDESVDLYSLGKILEENYADVIKTFSPDSDERTMMHCLTLPPSHRRTAQAWLDVLLQVHTVPPFEPL